MTRKDDSAGPGRDAIRDAFGVWNVDRVEREVVLRTSDDRYVAVPLPPDYADRFEELAGSDATVDLTLVAREGGSTSWEIDAVNGVERDE